MNETDTTTYLTVVGVGFHILAAIIAVIALCVT